MKRHILIVFCYLVLTANPVFADTKSIKVDVGGVKINIQAPAAFHEISSLSPETRKLIETMKLPNNRNRTLAVFVSEEDLGRIMKGETPNFDRYMVLQVDRELEDENISNAQFQQFANLIKEQHNTLLNKAKNKVGALIEGVGKKLSTEYDLSIKTQIVDLVPLGIFLDKSDAVGFASLAKLNIEAEGEQLDHVVAGGASFFLTRGKLLYAYVYSTYETQNDINWVRSKSKEWVDSLLTSNYTTISYPDSPWEGRLKRALEGMLTALVVVGLFAVVASLVRAIAHKRIGTPGYYTAAVVVGFMLHTAVVSIISFNKGSAPSEGTRTQSNFDKKFAAPPAVASEPFVVHCQQPIPEFTLGDDSNPTQDQVAQLCSCIWNKLGTWEKETAQAISQGRVNEVSSLNLRAFPYRFGGAIRDCGGMDL